MNKDKIKDILNTREIKHIGKEKEFSVLIPLIYPKEERNAPYVLFETRADSLDSQPGEVCFPGGQREDNESPLECAIRETEEELGISKKDIYVLGGYDIYTSYFDSVIKPFVAMLKVPISTEAMNKKDLGMNINKEEVKDVFLVPLSFFANENPAEYHLDLVPKIPKEFPYEKILGKKVNDYGWKSGKHKVPAYYYEDHVIWGITGKLIQSFSHTVAKGK